MKTLKILFNNIGAILTLYRNNAVNAITAAINSGTSTAIESGKSRCQCDHRKPSEEIEGQSEADYPRSGAQ